MALQKQPDYNQVCKTWERETWSSCSLSREGEWKCGPVPESEEHLAEGRISFLGASRKCRLCMDSGWWNCYSLPVQETWVQSPIQNTPHDAEQLSPVVQLLRLCSRARVLQLLKPTCPRACVPQQEKPPQWEAHALQLENSPRFPQLKKNPA